jgi:hypothetical protein
LLNVIRHTHNSLRIGNVSQYEVLVTMSIDACDPLEEHLSFDPSVAALASSVRQKHGVRLVNSRKNAALAIPTGNARIYFQRDVEWIGRARCQMSGVRDAWSWVIWSRALLE